MPHHHTSFPCLPRAARRHALALAVALVSAGAAHAQEADSAAPSWTFGGFGSLALAHSSEHQADYSSSLLKPNGPGHNGGWSAQLDSKLGAQLAVRLDQQWSGVLQLVSEQGIEGNYRPFVEWANIQYQATPDLSLRFGRIALAMFLAADYRKVGYAYPWLRPPVEVYGTIPFSSSDGVDASYRWTLGGVKQVDQLLYGHADLKLLHGTHLMMRALGGVTHTIEHGPFSARLSLLSARLAVELALPVFDTLRRFGPQGVALAARFGANDKRLGALGIGASYDPGNWFAMGEFGRMNGNSHLARTSSAYASAGYRFGAFTPYLSYASVRSSGTRSDPGLNLAGLPPEQAAAGAQLNGYLNWLLSAIPVQRTASIGARWDLMPSVALKFQYDRVRARGGSFGSMINAQPGFVPGRLVNLASVSLDFVF
jgi:hypothetical protein